MFGSAIGPVSIGRHNTSCRMARWMWRVALTSEQVCVVWDRWRAGGWNTLIARGWVCLPARRSHPLHLSAVFVAVDEDHPNVRLSLRDIERSQNTVTERRSPQWHDPIFVVR